MATGWHSGRLLNIVGHIEHPRRQPANFPTSRRFRCKKAAPRESSTLLTTLAAAAACLIVQKSVAGNKLVQLAALLLQLARAFDDNLQTSQGATEQKQRQSSCC